jgi:protein tyrosine/serine phosphatase
MIKRAFLLLSLGLVLANTKGVAGERGQPAKDGIGNFGNVNAALYRGAQPDEAAISSLKRLGIKAIINLRMADDVWKAEAATAMAYGIVYTNVPLRGVGRPADRQVKTILTLIETLPPPVFVHCEHGCDRTGTIIACYRLQHDKWSTDSALQEARDFGLSRLERGMKQFVVDFGKAVSAKSPPTKAAE